MNGHTPDETGGRPGEAEAVRVALMVERSRTSAVSEPITKAMIAAAYEPIAAAVAAEAYERGKQDFAAYLQRMTDEIRAEHRRRRD